MNNIRSTAKTCPEDQKANGIKWINGLLKANINSFQQLRDGVIWCRLLNRVYPGSIRMKSVIQRSGSVVDWYANYQLLYAALQKLDISVGFSVHKLVNGQDAEIGNAVCFFIEIYLMKKNHRQISSPIGQKDDKRKDNPSKTLPSSKQQSQATGSSLDFLPKFMNFFSFDKQRREYARLLDESVEEKVQKELEKQMEKFKHLNLGSERKPGGEERQEKIETTPQQQVADNSFLVAVNNKLESEQRCLHRLMHMCAELEIAELQMESLWLLKRQKRKMRHALCL